MNDLISRQAAIDALKHCAGVGNRALDKLRALPSADAVEVVRCNDCKHFHGDGLECRWGMYAYEDDFCSNGERREDA